MMTWHSACARVCQVRFWIHAKHPDRVKSSWARGRLIRRSFRPEWGSIEIVRAELELLQVAVAESSAQRLLLASETCVPIVPLARAAEVVFEKECSWVNARSTPNNGYSTAAQFDPPEQAGIPRDLIWKADQWCLLTRWGWQREGGLGGRRIEGGRRGRIAGGSHGWMILRQGLTRMVLVGGCCWCVAGVMPRRSWSCRGRWGRTCGPTSRR